MYIYNMIHIIKYINIYRHNKIEQEKPKMKMFVVYGSALGLKEEEE